MTDTPDNHDQIVAVSFLTAEELKNVGVGLKRLYPVPNDGVFDDLLHAIDRAASGKSASVLKFSKRSKD